VDFLLTASDGDRNELYYLATVCQLSLDPILISIAPNPEYPICEVIQEAGSFGLHAVPANRGDLVARAFALAANDPDKFRGFAFEMSERGIPLLTDCDRSLECNVLRAFDSGDHRTFVAEVIGQRVHPGGAPGSPHRFGGETSGNRHHLKRWLCQTGIYDLLMFAKRHLRPPQSIGEGTAEHIGEVSEYAPAPTALGQRQISRSELAGGQNASPTPEVPKAAAASGRRRAPETPGICLVGCGWWGGVHALQMKQMGGRIRRYFASRRLENAKDFVARFAGQKAFASLDAAIEDPRVDAVLICLPHHLHAEAAVKAIRAGKHVLVEKPLALDARDAEALVAAAEQAEVCLAVAEQYRLSPAVVLGGVLIGSDRLGRVTMAQASVIANFQPTQSWKDDREAMGGGVLLDVGIHYIDVLRSWFGEPDRVWAISPRDLQQKLRGEDAVAAVLRFADGIIANLNVSWSGHRSPDAPNIEVIGDRGSLRIWFRHPYVELSVPLSEDHWRHRAAERIPWRVFRLIEPFLPKVETTRLPVSKGDSIGSRALLEDFVEAIVNGTEAAVSGRDGLRDLEIVAATYRARDTGDVQTIPPQTEGASTPRSD
jgi:predicted dehydrogenase/flavin reductase (DIM6/NTAB) family NADH-FMN oxidoreductase RutF